MDEDELLDELKLLVELELGVLDELKLLLELERLEELVLLLGKPLKEDDMDNAPS